ncbi:hypothetical protein LIER_38497 [Lithospermum erythrorhizon]|uniref:Uncharacterized protein n=1 Tax=Lithospermum erythrorhizon TaxID=34254 RepID=A0AAV3Q5E5_LITER
MQALRICPNNNKENKQSKGDRLNANKKIKDYIPTLYKKRHKRRRESHTPEALQTTQEVPQSFIVTFRDEDIPEENGNHNHPPYISGYLCDVKMRRMPVDGESTVNILPFHILKLLNISTEDLQFARVMIQGFNQDGHWAKYPYTW